MITALLARLYPAAGATGTQGLPIPDPVSFTRVAAEGAPGTLIAGPERGEMAVDIATPIFPFSPEALFGALLRAGAAQARTWLSASYPTRLQAHFVARGARLNFPELIVAEARAVAPGNDVAGSFAMILIQPAHGGFGAGRRRRMLQDWLDQLEQELARPTEG